MSAKAVHGVQPGGRYKIRTCDPFRVREVRYHCANRPRRVTTYVIWRTSASAMSPPTRVRHVVSLWNHWFEGRYGGFVCMVGMLPTSDCAPGVAPGIAPSVAPRMRGAEFRHCRTLPYVPQLCPAHPGRNLHFSSTNLGVSNSARAFEAQHLR